MRPMRAMRPIQWIGGLIAAAVLLSAGVATARFRQANEEYAARRAKLAAQVDGPVVVFGYTGHEDLSEFALFFQEKNFYYLTGDDEPGGAVLLIPDPPAGKKIEGAREILYLPARDYAQEKWEGPKMGPDDPGIREKTGFRRCRRLQHCVRSSKNSRRLIRTSTRCSRDRRRKAIRT